jgi:dUTP pyrophosphatase
MKIRGLKIKVGNMQVSFRRLSPDTPIPEYKTSGACAFDIAVLEGKTVEPGACEMFSTGLVVAVPAGHTLLLLARSSSAKKGLRLGNSVGVIDQDYCGPNDEIKISLHNFGSGPYTVQKGERLVQGLVVPTTRVTLIEQTTLTSQNRGGFGTTG